MPEKQKNKRKRLQFKKKCLYLHHTFKMMATTNNNKNGNPKRRTSLKDLARELGVPMESIMKDRPGSYIVLGQTKGGSVHEN